MKKYILPVAVVLGAIGLIMTLMAFRSMKNEIATLRAQRNALFEVNENTNAILASVKRQRDQLLLAAQAADDLDGNLVGGVKIGVKKDTVYVPTTPVPTATDSVGTRTADKEFNVAEGDATVHVKAPPVGDLEVGLDWRPHPFEPEVGLVQKDGDYYWTVSWQGQKVEAKEAFYKPPRPHRLSIIAGGAAIGTYAIPAVAVTSSTYLGLDVAIKKGYKLGIDVGVHLPTVQSYGAISIEKTLFGAF